MHGLTCPAALLHSALLSGTSAPPPHYCSVCSPHPSPSLLGHLSLQPWGSASPLLYPHGRHPRVGSAPLTTPRSGTLTPSFRKTSLCRAWAISMPPALSAAVSSLPRVPCVHLWVRACVQTRVRMWEEPHIHPGPNVTAERETDKGLCSSSPSLAESEARAPSLPS